MDEIESGNAEPVASGGVTATSRRRTRVRVTVASGALVVVGALSLLAACSGGSHHSGAGSTDTTVGSDGHSGTQPGGSGTTSKGRGSNTDGSNPGSTGPGDTATGTTGSGSTRTTKPGDTLPGSSTPTTRHTSRPVTSTPHNPTGTTAPSGTVAPSVTLAYTAGYQAECRHIWAITADADGLLWDADWLEQGGFKVSICYSQENQTYAGTYDTPADARDGAAFDADSDMLDWTLGGTLTNTSRTKTWTGG